MSGPFLTVFGVVLRLNRNERGTTSCIFSCRCFAFVWCSQLPTADLRFQDLTKRCECHLFQSLWNVSPVFRNRQSLSCIWCSLPHSSCSHSLSQLYEFIIPASQPFGCSETKPFDWLLRCFFLFGLCVIVYSASRHSRCYRFDWIEFHSVDSQW